MKRASLINLALITGIAIAPLMSFALTSEAPGVFDGQSRIVPFISCEEETVQARSLIAADRQELNNYYQLKKLKPGEKYPAGEIQRARDEALNLLRQDRDNAKAQEREVLSRCSAAETESTLYGLEDAFDRMNIELAIAHIHHYDAGLN